MVNLTEKAMKKRSVALAIQTNEIKKIPSPIPIPNIAILFSLHIKITQINVYFNAFPTTFIA